MTPPQREPQRSREHEDAFLRKQAWDYFTIHSNQRMTVFNFYIVLSSLTVTSYFASFKNDSNLASAGWILALLLCFFAFIFWKLDQRNKALIKKAERALKYFERSEPSSNLVKVFLQEEKDTEAIRKLAKRSGRIFFWRWHLSFSDCFNCVYAVFASIGFGALVYEVLRHMHG